MTVSFLEVRSARQPLRHDIPFGELPPDLRQEAGFDAVEHAALYHVTDKKIERGVVPLTPHRSKQLNGQSSAK